MNVGNAAERSGLSISQLIGKGTNIIGRYPVSDSSFAIQLTLHSPYGVI